VPRNLTAPPGGARRPRCVAISCYRATIAGVQPSWRERRRIAVTPPAQPPGPASLASRRCARRRKQAAPLAGAPPRRTSCLATKRAPSLSVRLAVLCPGGLTCSDTPPAAGRAWVPGCRARTSKRPYPPFYDEIPWLKRPVTKRIRDLDQLWRSHSVNQWLAWRSPVPGAADAEKRAAPAGGESGRRAHGPALGGEAGSVLMRAYPVPGSRIDPGYRVSQSHWNTSGRAVNSTVGRNYCSVREFLAR
jgi:hypothetical protein